MQEMHCAHCDSNTLPTKTWVAGSIGLILLMISMFDLIPSLQTRNDYFLNWGLAVITLAVMGYSGRDFFVNAWQALRMYSANMDTLIVLSTSAAWLYSVGILIFLPYAPKTAQHVYFESSVIIIALVNLGLLLELRARRTASAAIAKLINLQPKTARLIRNNKELDVDITALKINDLLRVRPGEQIPVDGIITAGNAILDESMLTGEAALKNKTSGELVTGGTINQNSSFIFKATRVGANTTLAQIIRMVQLAQNSKPPLARLADKIAKIFVPIVIFIAIITAIVWLNFAAEQKYAHALLSSMSVLIIACPCALGMAVPISLIAGMGKAAQYGILIRQASVLQKIDTATYMLLDKTGTITQGRPTLLNIYPLPGYEPTAILEAAASLEAGSEHPLAQAIMNEAHVQKSVIHNANTIEIFAGLGISGNIANYKISIGNAAFMTAQLINVTPMRKQAMVCAEAGQTAIYVAKEKALIGLLAIGDPLKPEAKTFIQSLRKSIGHLAMLTGDHLATAKVIAQQVGIDEIFADVMPQEKANKIIELQQAGEVVVMVGDGINDAVALTQADVSIAMGNGADIAKQSADIILLNNSLTSLLDTLFITRKIMQNMRQNLAGAFLYNIIAIPIAAGALYPATGLLLNPMLACTAMALSSMTVVANANRLRFLKLG